MTWQVYTSEDGETWQRWESRMEHAQAATEMRFLRGLFPRLYVKATNR